MTINALFAALSSAQLGAYAMTVDQTIVFWNAAAERALGYSADDVIGRRCYEIGFGNGSGGISGECLGGCPSLRYVRSGLMPAPSRLNMRCASGESKWMTITPMAVAGIGDSPLLVHLFKESVVDLELEGERMPEELGACDCITAGENTHAPTISGEAVPLSRRELEVLRLIGRGWDTLRIAEYLGISRHTVSNHTRNLRNKLNVPTKLEAVLAGIRLGILDVAELGKHPHL